MRSSFTQRLTLAALFAALCAVLSQIQIPAPPVPLNLALIAVHLCGCLLPGRWGAAALSAYWLLGLIGLPVFSGFAGGPSVAFGPTGGFLAGYVLCAAAEGALLQSRGVPRMRTYVCVMAAGTACCYLLGAAWFSLVYGASAAAVLSACVLPFLPGDAVKILVSAHLCMRLKKALRAGGL